MNAKIKTPLAGGVGISKAISSQKFTTLWPGVEKTIAGSTKAGDFERIREALHFIPASDRDAWVKMGMAVKSELGDGGFDMWEEWSQQDESFDPKAARVVWKGIRANGKVTAGTLFREAKARGWRDDRTHQKPTPEELAERRRIAVEREAQEEAEIARERAEAAKKAAAIWKAATPASANHPYLSRKHVPPVATLREIDAGAAAVILGYSPKSNGKTLAGRLLVAPVKLGGKLSTCELIDEAGEKSAIYGGAKGGGFWSAQPLPEGDGDGLTLLIGEGVATVLSSKEASGHPSIAALSAGNLPAVAKAIRERYPAAVLVILADLVKATGVPDPHAIEAARSVGGLLAVPTFTLEEIEAFQAKHRKRPSDLNDMHQICGLEAVTRAVTGAIEAAWDVQQPDAGNAPAGMGTPKPDDCGTSSQTDVTGVTGVQASTGAALGVTAAETPDVTDVTPDPIIPDEQKRPCFKVFDAWQKFPDDIKLKPGVWHFGVKHGKGDAPATLTQQWICSPLHIKAVTFDGQDNNHGRLLRFKTTSGKWREWAMPMDMLAGDGVPMRAELLGMGVLIDPHAGRNLLGQYLQAVTPKRRVHCAQQVGWCGESFVLPDTVIGPNASNVIFQSGEREHCEHTRAGTLAGWQSEIAAKAVGNPLLTLALSASFAGPLLARCNGESGGFHFVGDSSTGKTTAIDAACATWGGPNFRRSWRATANGMEGAAASFNDCLLALDEISECDPREVGAIVYALGNGRGKQRASRTGTARGVTRWRCSVLSSGERTIATTMADGGYRAKAGQSVRLLDIPAARKHGAFDDLHGFPSGGAFADAIRRAASAHHGHAGRAFLEKLTRDKQNFSEQLERIKALPKFSADDGQDKRAAGRFALIALAGELSTEYGITGWPEGAAMEAAEAGFAAWRSLRGGGNDEPHKILEQVCGFIERHGDSRFSRADEPQLDDTMRLNRAGWYRGNGGERVYLFNAEGMREAVKGFDFKRALNVLQEAGALPENEGERAKAQRIGGRLVRVYTVKAEQLGGDLGA